MKDPPIRALVIEESRCSAITTIDYLNELDIGRGRWAIVTIGLIGESAAALSAILERHTGQRPLTLHFGGNRIDPLINHHLDARRFVRDGADGRVPNVGVTDAIGLLLNTSQDWINQSERCAVGDTTPVLLFDSPGIDPRLRSTLDEAATRVAHRLGFLPDEFRPYLVRPGILRDVSSAVFGTF
ncbi:MAG: hypothetical protein R2706_07725 [Acidimicrobiales bacterium]